MNKEDRSEQIRRLLELAFEHHLDRLNKGGRRNVEIRTADTLESGQYHYLDIGKGRGVAHYFRGLTPAMKADIRRLVTAENLAILAEGAAYLSVSAERFDISTDVRFVERVI